MSNSVILKLDKEEVQMLLDACNTVNKEYHFNSCSIRKSERTFELWETYFMDLRNSFNENKTIDNDDFVLVVNGIWLKNIVYPLSIQAYDISTKNITRKMRFDLLMKIEEQLKDNKFWIELM